MADVAQLVRASGCGSEGRGFDSRRLPQAKNINQMDIIILAIITAVIFYRLNKSLGTIDEDEKREIHKKLLERKKQIEEILERAQKSANNPATQNEKIIGSKSTSQKEFDEINSDQITGRLRGGTGTDKDFAVGGILESDGKTIKLNDNLPGSFVDVVVTYIPVDSSGDRVLITKDKESNIVFSITASGKTSILTKKVDWKKNTWHRISCMYKTNSTSDSMRLFVDGSENGQILYGDPSLVYGSGYLYGQIGNQSGQSQKINYNIND